MLAASRPLLIRGLAFATANASPVPASARLSVRLLCIVSVVHGKAARSLVGPLVLGLVVHDQPRRRPGEVETVRPVAVRVVHLTGVPAGQRPRAWWRWGRSRPVAVRRTML